MSWHLSTTQSWKNEQPDALREWSLILGLNYWSLCSWSECSLLSGVSCVTPHSCSIRKQEGGTGPESTSAHTQHCFTTASADETSAHISWTYCLKQWVTAAQCKVVLNERELFFHRSADSLNSLMSVTGDMLWPSHSAELTCGPRWSLVDPTAGFDICIFWY